MQRYETCFTIKCLFNFIISTKYSSIWQKKINWAFALINRFTAGTDSVNFSTKPAQSSHQGKSAGIILSRSKNTFGSTLILNRDWLVFSHREIGDL